jgi:hypothetical protein
VRCVIQQTETSPVPVALRLARPAQPFHERDIPVDKALLWDNQSPDDKQVLKMPKLMNNQCQVPIKADKPCLHRLLVVIMLQDQQEVLPFESCLKAV